MKARRRAVLTDRDEKTDHVRDHVHVNVDVDVVVHVLVETGLRLFENLSLTTVSDDGGMWPLGPRALLIAVLTGGTIGRHSR